MGKTKDARRLENNQAMAVGNSIRTSSRKLNLVAQSIRGLKAEKAVADSGDANERKEEQIEFRATKHFCGGIAAGRPIFDGFRRLYLTLFRKAEYVRSGKKGGCHDETEREKGIFPAERFHADQRFRQRAEKKGAYAVSHHQQTGADSGSARKPWVKQGDYYIVGCADAQTTKHTVSEIKIKQTAFRDMGGHPFANEDRGSGTEQNGFMREKFCQTASQPSANAEKAKRDCKIQGELRRSPAELCLQRHL